jgi:hypothetical protein
MNGTLSILKVTTMHARLIGVIFSHGISENSNVRKCKCKKCILTKCVSY